MNSFLISLPFVTSFSSFAGTALYMYIKIAFVGISYSIVTLSTLEWGLVSYGLQEGCGPVVEKSLINKGCINCKYAQGRVIPCHGSVSWPTHWKVVDCLPGGSVYCKFGLVMFPISCSWNVKIACQTRNGTLYKVLKEILAFCCDILWLIELL